MGNPSKQAPPTEVPTPVPPSDTSDALEIVNAMLAIRVAVARIHSRQRPHQPENALGPAVPERDGVPATGALVAVLAGVAKGSLPGFPADPMPLKFLVDQKKFAESEDPFRNTAAAELVHYLYTCLEEGRLRPGRGDAVMAQIAAEWPKLNNRGEAVKLKEATFHIENKSNLVSSMAAHEARNVAKNLRGASLPSSVFDQKQGPGPIVPEETVG